MPAELGEAECEATRGEEQWVSELLVPSDAFGGPVVHDCTREVAEVETRRPNVALSRRAAEAVVGRLRPVRGP